MKFYLKESVRNIAISATMLVLLSACGGSHSPLPGPGATPVNAVTGVAATGAPIFGTITLKDTSTPSVELTTATASDGTFIFTTENLKAPFILKCVHGGNTYFSIATEGGGITNINPLTTLVVSTAAGGTDLALLYNSWNTSTSAAPLLNLPTADIAVQTAIAPLLTQFGVSGSLLNSTFVADHTGADAMLDVVTVAIASGTVTLTNKNDSTVVFTAPASNIRAGTVISANIPAVPVQSLGATLYSSNCTKCHGDIQNSSIIGRSSVVKIMAAISSDFGGMSVLGALTPEEIQTISDAIPTTPPAAGSLSGSALYASKCQSCHGPLATSAKLGVTIVRLQNAISANTGNMSTLTSVSATDLQAIVVALNPATTAPPPSTTLDGATIYASNCAGCHGPLETSTKKGISIARFYNAVTSNSVTGMGYLSKLSVAEVQALISVLPPIPPTSGASPGQILYEANCSGCHGAFATSSKGGATTSRIQAAITNNTGAMGSFSTLTTTNIADIASALSVIAPPPTVLDGPGLYAAYCASCHGVLTSSAKGGATTTRINLGIANNPGPMGSFSSLTAAQITSIASALAGITPPPPPLDGPGLYAANCASCHGVLTSSTKGGATAARINLGITNNPSPMGSLSTLSAAQITLIETALAGITPPPPPLDGPGLYAANCASCHGVLTSSTKGGATATRINLGITNNPGPMGSLSTLTATQITLIESALAGITPPPPPLDGPGLYAAYCASCHGDLNSSAKGGATVARINLGITNNPGPMGSFATLSSTDITKIATALAGITPPPPPLDGPGLYAANCASCHGTLSLSAKGGATVARINLGITNNPGSMGSLSTLTQAQIALIEAALAGITPPPPPLDGAGLYASNCASCHGVLSSSTKGGATVARINLGITNNPGPMGSLATLSSAQVTLIASALATVTPPVPVDGPGLYVANCAGCHNPLATTAKGGATAAKIQASINSNRGGMASLASLTTAQINLIAGSLATIAPPACGSCHAVTLGTTAGVGILNSGRHGTHISKPNATNLPQFTAATSCAICHGAGYTTTSNGNLVTHNDGTKNVVTATTAPPARVAGVMSWIRPVISATGTVTTRGSCAPACHNPTLAKRSW